MYVLSLEAFGALEATLVAMVGEMSGKMTVSSAIETGAPMAGLEFLVEVMSSRTEDLRKLSIIIRKNRAKTNVSFL